MSCEIQCIALHYQAIIYNRPIFYLRCNFCFDIHTQLQMAQVIIEKINTYSFMGKD